MLEISSDGERGHARVVSKHKSRKKPHKSRSGAGWGESETMYKSNKNTDKQTKLASFSEKRDKRSWG